MAASRTGSAGRPIACAARCRPVFTGFRMAARVSETARAASARGTPPRVRAWKAGSVLRSQIILPLALPERNYGDLVLFGKDLDGANEPLADGVHQGGRGEGMPSMETEERCHSRFGLETGDVDVEVQTVDPLHLQGNPVAKDLRDATRYTHLWLRLTRSLGTISRLAAQYNGPSPSGLDPTLNRSLPEDPQTTAVACLHLVGLRRSLVRDCHSFP